MPCASSNLLVALSWDTQLTRWIVWVGLVALTVALLLLIRTRWGQSQPLSKCIVLSLLAHLLLGIYITTVYMVSAPVGTPQGRGVQVALATAEAPPGALDPATDPAPWDRADTSAADAVMEQTELGPRAALADLPPAAEIAARAQVEVPTTTVPLPAPAGPEPGAPVTAPQTDPIAARGAAAEAADLPEEPLDLVPPPDPATASADKSAAGGDSAKSTTAEGGAAADKLAAPRRQSTADSGAGASAAGPPGMLRERLGDHLRQGRGATPQSEAAVQAALTWLAANQRPSGRWESRGLGGGGRAADGEERFGAGLQADSGLTGLALLAFLAAGHTHERGPHQHTVQRGLEYLLGIQDADGCLGATTHRYERMYCHAMAACALSEALAMTGDRRLRLAVERAIDYTVRAQDRATGGWRYMPGDPGDTSQLGWQLMALKSAELGGIPIPQATRDGIARFLASVATGQHRGLACYQPQRPIATPSMTAEALVCRQFLGTIEQPDALNEARAFLLQELPGASRTNHYYWYYATLALYRSQGDAWEAWNSALQKNLLAGQRQDGAMAGSWDPDPVWGPCGGRVYSTALAALCLEVYYRFLPLYVEAAGRDRRVN